MYASLVQVPVAGSILLYPTCLAWFNLPVLVTGCGYHSRNPEMSPVCCEGARFSMSVKMPEKGEVQDARCKKKPFRYLIYLQPTRKNKTKNKRCSASQSISSKNTKAFVRRHFLPAPSLVYIIRTLFFLSTNIFVLRFFMLCSVASISTIH